MIPGPKKKKKTSKKRRKKLGRPKGHKLVKFDETRVGYFLKHEVPVEYKLLMEVTEYLKLRAPSPDLIESVAYSSDDTFFKKAKFWRALIEYRQYALRPPVAMQANARKELYYIRIRFKKAGILTK